MWELRDASVRFGSTTALDGVDLRVDPGEIVVILGPSGCGKSTLLRALAGLQPLDRGNVWIDGRDATREPPHTRGIGLMFQDPTLFPHRTVGDNVAFGLRMLGWDRAARADRVAEMLDLVGLPDFAARAVDTLSGGEAQRVALARSLAPGPRLLLLDEPWAALDRTLRDRLTAEIPALLRSTGTSAVHVTHDHDEAFAIADRVAVMHRGRVLRVAPPAELFADPRTATVARFLGHENIVDDGAGRRVIRRDAASVDEQGELDVRVTGCRFRGDHHDVTVASDLGTLRFHLDRGFAIGAAVRLHIDPDRVAPLADD